jgi:DNA-binding response OmpR family regulator
MRVLVVEDERKVASFIARALRENAYAVDIAETGEKALEMAAKAPYDVILLDVRLPGLSGIEVCRELRASGVEAPILMLTARSLVEQRVEGLDAGADDYLVKPFALAELHARVRALIRRGFKMGGGRLRYADL